MLNKLRETIDSIEATGEEDEVFHLLQNARYYLNLAESKARDIAQRRDIEAGEVER
jgi:hypothetical protein